jgi:hypothetical protein
MKKRAVGTIKKAGKIIMGLPMCFLFKTYSGRPIGIAGSNKTQKWLVSG